MFRIFYLTLTGTELCPSSIVLRFGLIDAPILVGFRDFLTVRFRFLSGCAAIFGGGDLYTGYTYIEGLLTEVPRVVSL